jgi:hypothetical protein
MMRVRVRSWTGVDGTRAQSYSAFGSAIPLNA